MAVVGLTFEDRTAIEDDGYLVVPALVPTEQVRAALTAINASIGEHGLARDDIDLARMRASTFCPELTRAPVILDLFRASPLATLADEALGRGRVRTPGDAQIALRFPDPGEARVGPRPHIDGLPRPGNGVPAGTLYHFTALAGVFLSDVDAAFAGNFTVWPGSHRAMAAHLALGGGGGGVAALAHPDATFPPVPLSTPRQLTVKAGDALLAHYLLVHGVAANLGPHVRYAVFFRLFHQDHDSASTSVSALGDLWREWEGLRAVH